MKAYSENVKINTPISNNFFSYEKRVNKTIYIPTILEGNVKDIKLGKKPAFIEIDENEKEIECIGLENFIKQKEKNIYIFDNHNHSFYFTYNLFLNTKKKYDFIHIDQHKDLREPYINFSEYKKQIGNDLHKIRQEFEKINLEINFDENDTFNLEDMLSYLYTNIVLNVGNFIKPLLEEGVIDKFYCIDSSYNLEELKNYNCERDYIVDLDLDFFSSEMDYIPESVKIALIRKIIKQAKLVIIATSPYFIEFEKCKSIMAKIFE